ncbi:hypothetical protein DdX_00983 [Ditylenchus destructor]|uniref:Uncharacterized protein n=1 Tax=Ditylenchus destructor TaxID=166010 RepID=A0AAD4RDN1_9BILA|nr:hypothetical protein DdX_00983 [Ditylenchus destructor]
MPINFFTLFLTLALLSTFFGLIIFAVAALFFCNWGISGSVSEDNVLSNSSIGDDDDDSNIADHLSFDNALMDRRAPLDNPSQTIVQVEARQDIYHTNARRPLPKIVLTTASLKSRPI